MAELGGMLAAAILKVVGDQIGAAIGGQIKLQKNFDADLKKMKMALESVEAVLEDAARLSITDKATLLWLKRLKDVMYAISDMIDEFEVDTDAIKQPSARKFSFKKYLEIIIPCLTIGPKIIVANKMEKVREDLEVITDQHKKFKLVEGNNTNEPKVTNIQETSSMMEAHIVGRAEDKDEILSSLYGDMAEAITILPIYGIGGLGKTTLAKMVYNSSQFKEYSQVWVYVSQTFDLVKIGNSIISQLSEKGEQSKYTEMQMIHNSLQKLLTDKKILIVLDDLWEGEEFLLESLRDMLTVGNGSNVVVIVTTRDEAIAKNISTIHPYKLAPLSDDMCWSIIKQNSAFESRGDKEQLEKIGKVIAMKCGGMALAAKSLGHMLQSMKPSEWELVRDSNIWTASSLRDTSSSKVLASLKLSYSVMPSNLKLCFAYCAIFPKGHKILKDDLIHQWVSLGYSTQRLGEKYISQLLGICFLEHSKSRSAIEQYDENITFFTMHDLVHDLARSVMENEILVTGKGSNSDESCYRYALLDDCSKPLGMESSKIRALRFMDSDKIELHDAAFASVKSVRVLDLSECIIHKLPDCIGELKQLRYLNIPRVQDAAISDSITKLSKLIYLNLHGSPTILALPESIGEIKGLMYLDLSGCSGIENLPESFGRLKELVHLDLSNCSSVGGISAFLGSLTQLQYLNLSYCPNIGDLPDALGGLSNLEYLNFSFSSYLEHYQEAEVLCTLTKLEYLNLSSEKCLQVFPESLGRSIHPKYLNLSGFYNITEFPRIFGPTCLQYLNLAGTRISSLPAGLTKLSYLNLSHLHGHSDGTFYNLVDHICSTLSYLEYLDLSDNSNLTRIPESIVCMRKLHTLDLSECWDLSYIPDSIGTIDGLKFLILNGCSSISIPPQLSSSAVSLPHFVVQPGYGDSSSNIVQLQSIDPVELQISKLENVKSVVETHCMKLVGKQKLEDLKLEWTEDAERFVDDRILLENLVPPSTLKKLEICHYNGVSFPSWVVGQLPNLEKLFLRDLPNLKLWVVLQLPNLNELVLSGMASLESLVLRDMEKLKSVVLSDMANLEEWDTSYSIGEESVIEELEIHDCPKLRMKPFPPRAKSWEISSDNVLSSWEECTASHTNASSSSSPITIKLSVKDCNVPINQWRLLQHLSGRISLCISSCGDLTGSSETSQYLSSVEKLHLRYEDLEELPEWLGELTSLRKLEINEWRRLKGLQDNMRQLIKLQSLELKYCNIMASLPHWLGELPSLKILTMWDCDVLRCFAESIKQLTSLRRLSIASCPELKHFVESEEGKLDVNHNQEKVCVLPISLEALYIHRCEGIKSLPDGIQQLTNLQDLYIRGCPELKEWCELEENHMKLAHIKEKEICE